MRTLIGIAVALGTLFLFPGAAQAQSATRGEGSNIAQPRIMVVPFTKEGEDVRAVIEDDFNQRMVITKVKEYFDARGFTTVDFVARLKAANTNAMMSANAQTDIKTQIISMSGADIYVVPEMGVSEEPNGTNMSVLLTAYEVSTGNSLVNMTCSSGRFMTNDIGKLAAKAVADKMEDFLAVLQDKFTDIVENGRSIQLEINVLGSSDTEMYADLPSGSTLADAIEEWLSANAYKGDYHVQGVSDKQMILDVVKIPLRDQQTGNNYSPSRFGAEFAKFLKAQGLEAERSVRNQTLIFSIK